MRTGNKRDGPFRPCRAGDGDANGLITVTRQRWTERISTRTCTPHDHTLPTNRTHLRNPGHRAEGAGRPARGQTPEGRHPRLGRRRHSLVTPSTCPLLTGAELGGGGGKGRPRVGRAVGRASPRAPGTGPEGAAAPCCACSPGGPGHPQFSHPQNSVFSTAPWGRKTPPSFPVYGHSVHGGWVLTRSHHVLPKPDEGDEASRTA